MEYENNSKSSTETSPGSGLPKISELEVEDELIYYDGPLLYIARDKKGRKFLVHWVDTEMGEGPKITSLTWIIAPQDEAGILSLREGRTDIRQACRGVTGYVYKCIERGKEETTTQIPTVELPEELQAEPGVYLTTFLEPPAKA